MFALKLTFIASDGSRKTITVPNVDENIDPVRVEDAMNQIIAADVVARNDIRYYTRIYTAQTVRTDTNVLVDHSSDPIVTS